MNRRIVAPLLILLGTILIVACGSGTLWFDEILSFQWAKSAKNPWQLLELYRHDNNHPVNSLWLMIVGENGPPWAYRALSMASGVCSLVLIHSLATRLSPRFAWVPLLLAATSFPLVLYFSEARGYAPAMACLLGASLLVWDRRMPVWRAPLFWLLCGLAVLSHGTSLMLVAALGAFACLRGVLEKTPLLRLLGGLAAWFAIPCTVGAAYWWFFLRQMIIAGGPEYGVPAVVAHFFGYALGIPGAGSGSPWIGVLGGVWVVTAWIFGRFPDSPMRWFFVFATGLFPALSLLAADATYLYFRYFLVALPFVYLLSAPLAERISELGRLPLIGSALLLATLVAAQTPRLWTLATQGRGDYLAALRRIVSDSSTPPVVVSNNDLQVGVVVGHLRSRHSELHPIQFRPQKSVGEVVPGWILYATQDDPPSSPGPLIDWNHRRYALVAQHFSAPVSGAHWTLYKLQPSTP